MGKSERLVPGRIVPPGATIKVILDNLDMSQREFAAMIERPETFVSELLKGKRAITLDTARRLSAALGNDTAFWLRMEAGYRDAIEPADQELMFRIASRRKAA